MEMTERISTGNVEIERLFDFLIHQPDVYQDFEETAVSHKEFLQWLEILPISKNTFINLEVSYAKSVMAYEQQGFIYGFKFATKLMREALANDCR